MTTNQTTNDLPGKIFIFPLNNNHNVLGLLQSSRRIIQLPIKRPFLSLNTHQPNLRMKLNIFILVYWHRNKRYFPILRWNKYRRHPGVGFNHWQIRVGMSRAIFPVEGSSFYRRKAIRSQ